VCNTHFTVYWNNEGNTDPQKGDVKVQGVPIVILMNDYNYHNTNSSTRIGESGSRPYGVGGDRSPVDSKMLMFVLSIQLIECYVINCIRSRKKNILCVYIHSVICDIHFGDEFLDFYEQIFI
jgi:hypothetical protein